MKLYYKSGACSMASHIILNELDLPFDLDRVDTVKGETETGAPYNSINAKGYVPALMLDDNRIITENMAILQYLADLQPKKNLTLKAGSFERIQLHEVLSFLATELHKAYAPFFTGDKLSDAQKNQTIEVISKRIKTIELYLMDGRPFLMGQQYTVADAYAFVIINWSNFVNISLESWPNTQAFMQRISARKATQKAMIAEGLIT